MTANSFIELYLTVFGWILYDGIWSILTDTGIAYLPFFGILARNFVEPYTSQNEREASTVSVKRMEVDIAIALTVIVLAAQPVFFVSIPESRYTPTCSNGGAVSGGATGTTYDSAFSAASIGGQTALVPIWWTMVLRLSAGVTEAALVSIPCDFDLRQLKYELNLSYIEDPETLRQLDLFEVNCWRPSRADFASSHDVLPPGTDVNDINWIGSEYFQEAGYYDRYQAGESIPGFPFQATKTGNTAIGRDSAYYNTDLPKPQWGYPLCSEWWSDSQNGLRTKVLAEIEPTVLNDITQAMTAQGLTQREVDDYSARLLLEIKESSVQVGPDSSSAGFLKNPAGQTAGAIGLKLEKITLFPKIILLKQASPIVQSLLLMIVYVTLPFILVFSSYSIGTTISVSIIIFAIKFLTVFWEIARWLDTNLQKALLIGRGRDDVVSRASDFLFRDGLFDTVETDIIELTLAILYVVVPFIWVFGLGLAGVAAAKSIGSLISDATRPVSSAGDKGGNELVRTGKNGLRRFKR